MLCINKMSLKQQNHRDAYHYANTLIEDEYPMSPPASDDEEVDSENEAEFRQHLLEFYQTINEFTRSNPGLSPSDYKIKLEECDVDTEDIKRQFEELFEGVPDSNDTKINMQIALAQIGILWYKDPEEIGPLEKLAEDLKKEIDEIILS